MRASWLIALAAGAAMGTAVPTELMAQGNSSRARQQQQARPQQPRENEQARAEARRAAERAQREREQQARELQRQRTQRPQPAYGTIQRRADDRYEDRNRRNDRDRRYDDRDRRYDDRDWRHDDRYDRRGPAFCRSGEGHPVHGRQWCRQKGFGLGYERSRDIWGDIIFRQPRDRRYDDRQLSRGTLADILGSVVLGRFDSYGRTYYGGNSQLSGRWLPESRSSVLQLYMGTMPIARLVDTDRDGRVDSVVLTR